MVDNIASVLGMPLLICGHRSSVSIIKSALTPPVRGGTVAPLLHLAGLYVMKANGGSVLFASRHVGTGLFFLCSW